MTIPEAAASHTHEEDEMSSTTKALPVGTRVRDNKGRYGVITHAASDAGWMGRYMPIVRLDSGRVQPIPESLLTAVHS